MKSKLKHFNFLMFAAMIALIAIGTIAIYSAGHARTEYIFHGMWINNLVTAVFGLALYFIIAFTDYRKILDLASVPGYAVAIVLLVAVLIFGTEVYGGKRWLWFFQPSEISKLFVIMFLAWVLGGNLFEERGFKVFLISLAIIGVPSILILKEPDLGTTLTLIPATFLMMLVAKVWRKGIIVMFAIGAIAALAVLGAVYEAEKPGCSEERHAKIMKYVPLKPHQVKRVKVFLFPDEDTLGAGYNLRQAKCSIGSGGFSGKGIGKGEVNHLKFLPQSISMNDFIFCVYAEETGYVGSLVLLFAFGMLIIPSAWVAFASKNDSGRLLALGISTLIFAHVYVNIAMSIGLVPITGLPLPFISSGRTFLLTVMLGLGLIQSVSMHREER